MSPRIAQFGGIPVSVVLILVVELCERFCYYTIQGSQKFFLQQQLGYNNAQSTSITTVFNTACYITCLGGGVIADRFLGRYLTITSLGSLYVAGTFLVAFSTNPHFQSSTVFFIGAFAGVAVGTGGIKPIVCNFGADQIPESQDADKAKEKFFSFFYWAINIGAAVGLALMTTVATSPTDFGIPAGYGFFWSYLTAAIAMGVCISLFLSGTCFYVKKFVKSQSRIFRPVAKILVVSARQSFRGAVCLTGWVLLLPFFVLSFIQAFVESGSGLAYGLAFLAFGIALLQLLCLVWSHCDNSFLKEEESQAADSEDAPVSLEELRQTFQSLPVILVANIIFNFAYTMMIGPFLSESCQMNLHVGTGQISGAFFNVGDSFAIIFFIPVFESVVFPLIERRRQKKITIEEKMYGGFCFAAVGMVAATVIEISRRASPILAPAGWAPGGSREQNFPGFVFNASGPYQWSHYDSLMGPCIDSSGVNFCSNCAPTKPYPYCEGASCPDNPQTIGIYMSRLSSWWMMVPFACIGLGEILVNPALYYLSYNKTPPKTQSVIQAINLVYMGAFPPALVGVFSTVFADDQPNNLNKGHLEIFYYISLAFIFLGTPIFYFVCKVCNVQETQTENQHFLQAGVEEQQELFGSTTSLRAAAGVMASGSFIVS